MRQEEMLAYATGGRVVPVTESGPTKGDQREKQDEKKPDFDFGHVKYE